MPFSEVGTALSADTTDVTSTYINSFTTSNNLTKSGNTIILPASSTSGFNQDNYSFVYNSGNKTNNCDTSGCYSYYSWDAATLGSGRSISTDNTDAPYSICPKGWRLPISGGDTDNGWKRGDFYTLAASYGANLESSNLDDSETTGGNFYNNAGPVDTIPNFRLVGRYYVDSFLNGTWGYYQSATSRSNSSAYNLSFNSTKIYAGRIGSRMDGLSTRCLFRDGG